jgi:GrpB-like predicted nucleotidyltransferase (UPF0157 family)
MMLDATAALTRQDRSGGSGAQSDGIVVVPHDASWSTRFRIESRLLQVALSDLAPAIEHIGSTSVPGLAAKPVIDIMAGVASLDASRAALEAAARLGYCYFPYRPDQEHWFCKPSAAFRTHHLHLMPAGGPEWIGTIAFRDYLRAHPEIAAEYAELKTRLARQYRDDREAYTQAKGPFITRVTRAALEAGRPASSIE